MLATVRLLLAKVRPHDFRIAYNVLRQAIGDLAPGHQDGDALGELHHRPHDVLDHDHGDALAVQPDQQRDDLVDLGVRQPSHHLVGDQQLGVAAMARASSSLRISIWVRSRGRWPDWAASPTSPKSSRQRESIAAPWRWPLARAFTA